MSVPDFFEAIGLFVLKRFRGLYDLNSFAIEVLYNLFNLFNYNRLMLYVMIRQIYFSSLQVFALYGFISLVLGTVLIGATMLIGASLGISRSLEPVFASMLVSEIAPIFALVFYALRSSSAINTEIAIMNVTNEIESLHHFNISPMSYLYMPRIIAGVISLFMMSGLFIMLSYLGGYLFAFLYSGYSINFFLVTFISPIGLVDIIMLLMKIILFGYFAVLLPIYTGLNLYEKTLNAVPVSVLQGMVRLFLSITIIEVLSLLLRLM
jgi:phospholipid/cholesterol/gamma-HCH transport system permease protein